MSPNKLQALKLLSWMSPRREVRRADGKVSKLSRLRLKIFVSDERVLVLCLMLPDLFGGRKKEEGENVEVK